MLHGGDPMLMLTGHARWAKDSSFTPDLDTIQVPREHQPTETAWDKRRTWNKIRKLTSLGKMIRLLSNGLKTKTNPQKTHWFLKVRGNGKLSGDSLPFWEQFSSNQTKTGGRGLMLCFPPPKYIYFLNFPIAPGLYIFQNIKREQTRSTQYAFVGQFTDVKMPMFK